MRDKKIISFKEFYLREDHHTGYFPTFKAGWEGAKKHGPKVAKGVGKAGWGATKLGAKGAWGATKLGAKGIAGAAKGLKKGFDKGARGLTNFAKNMDPGYKKQFDPMARGDDRDKLSTAKSTREVNRRFANWRDKWVTKKDGTSAEQKAWKDFTRSGAVHVPKKVFEAQNVPGLYAAFADAAVPKYDKFFEISATGVPLKLKMGQLLPLMILKSETGMQPAGIVDGKYRKEGTPWPKVFDRPGHYANQFIDSMKRYVDTGYTLQQAIKLASKNFNEAGLAILRRNKYLPWESL